MSAKEISLPSGRQPGRPIALLRSAWRWLRAIPLWVQVVVWGLLAVVFAGPSLLLLYVPVVTALWLWERGWPALGQWIRSRNGSGNSSVQHTIARTTRTDMGLWLRHLAEMIVAMYAGMIIYHMLVVHALTALGIGVLFEGDLGYAWMVLFMVLPMVLLMRLQGHNWRMTIEMSAGMVVPIILCFGLVRMGICPLVPFLTWLSEESVYWAAHDAMLLGMIAVMVYRRGMYAVVEGCARRIGCLPESRPGSSSAASTLPLSALLPRAGGGAYRSPRG